MQIIAEPAASVTAHRKSVPANVAAALGMALERSRTRIVGAVREGAGSGRGGGAAGHGRRDESLFSPDGQWVGYTTSRGRHNVPRAGRAVVRFSDSTGSIPNWHPRAVRCESVPDRLSHANYAVTPNNKRFVFVPYATNPGHFGRLVAVRNLFTELGPRLETR
jgi:hypothetical protein